LAAGTALALFSIERRGVMNGQPGSEDRRGLGRFQLRLRSLIQRLKDREEILELYTRDVSSNGAFFFAENPLPIDTSLSMTLFLPVGESVKSKISVEGMVVRSENDGMAVRFAPNYSLVAN
jgi:hypothetical protein